MANFDFRTVAILSPKGVWHNAQQNQDTGELLTSEQCNIDDVKGTLELYPDLPEWVRGSELCKRCYPTTTDR